MKEMTIKIDVNSLAAGIVVGVVATTLLVLSRSYKIIRREYAKKEAK